MVMVYNYALVMRDNELYNTSHGEIINLLSSDAQKLYDLMGFIHLVWGAPLMVIIASALLIYFLGVSAIPGIFALLIVAPINIFLSNWQARVRKIHLPAMDRRVQIINEVLHGIRVVKCFFWEENFEKKILEARNEETECIRKELLTFVLSISLIIVFPMWAILVTFTMYARLVGPLNAADTFAVLAIFTIAKFPLTFLGQLISNIGQSYVSIQRFMTFLALLDKDVSECMNQFATVQTFASLIVHL